MDNSVISLPSLGSFRGFYKRFLLSLLNAKSNTLPFAFPLSEGFLARVLIGSNHSINLYPALFIPAVVVYFVQFIFGKLKSPRIILYQD